MSGKPNRYASDPAMYRDQYMETLGLRANIDDMNLQANKTYKATGQLPPVSQMPETRTTSEILADNERLKIDLIKILAPITDAQLALAIIQRLQNSPFNTSGGLFTFFAQRAPEIVKQLQKSYSLKIKGDQNDVETFVSFIESMFTQTKSMTSTVSDFFKNSSNKEYNILDAKDFNKIYIFFNNVIAKLSAIAKPSSEIGKQCNRIAKSLSTYSKFLSYVELFNNVKQIITLDPEKYSMIESGNQINLLDNFYDVNTRYIEIMRSFPSENRLYTLLEQLDTASKNKQTGLISNILLSIEELVSMTNEITILNNDITDLNIRLKNIKDGVIIIQPQQEQEQTQKQKIMNDIVEIDKKIDYKQGLIFNIEKNIEKSPDQEKRLRESILRYKKDIEKLIENRNKKETELQELELNENNLPSAPPLPQSEDNQEQQIPTDQLPEINLQPSPPPPKQHDTGGGEGEPRKKSDAEITLENKINFINKQVNIAKKRANDHYEALQKIDPINNKDEYDRINKNFNFENKLISGYEYQLAIKQAELKKISGNGIMKRRGRPRGCGIVKQKPYSESVKAHVSYDKGIMESPRFVRFGKYLVNNHKLNNDDIFALKQPSGGALQEFPSIRLSKHLSNVIKKMVGGGVPSYNDLNGLSEPEKTYLHKVSTRSNIVDKFSIPAPNKDQYEKDIHEFEVLKGEIMAGNDSKELIKKFKLHLMKLSKMGSLPKREVSEVMEELIQMGY